MGLAPDLGLVRGPHLEVPRSADSRANSTCKRKPDHDITRLRLIIPVGEAADQKAHAERNGRRRIGALLYGRAHEVIGGAG